MWSHQPVGGSGGMPPPQEILRIRCSEEPSDLGYLCTDAELSRKAQHSVFGCSAISYSIQRTPKKHSIGCKSNSRWPNTLKMHIAYAPPQ